MQHFEKSIDFLLQLLAYVPTTLSIWLISVLIGSLLGLIFAVLRLSESKLLSYLSLAYCQIIRGTPFIVLLFVVFYGLPIFLKYFGLTITSEDKHFYLIITLVLFSAARLSDVFRSAYLAVDSSQSEAGQTIGLNQLQILWHITGPQAIVLGLANFINIAITVLLETSLGFTIGVVDILGMAKLMNARSYGSYTLEIYLVTACIYWVMTIMITNFGRIIEKKLSHQLHVTAMNKGDEINEF